MGWAKYHEDIVSRWVGDNYMKGRPERRALPQMPAKTCMSAAAGKSRAKASSTHAMKEKIMSELKEFTMPLARPLPVIVLADISGSMSTNGKIDILNEAVRDMIAIFAEEDDTRAEIHVAVITFGGKSARLHKPLKPASEVTWESMAASGRTPLGGAFAIAQQLIEDRTVIPGRAYRPTLVLVSDGVPTDDWKTPLAALLGSERASKAGRFAMGIGDDADTETLKAFLAGDGARVFQAHEARDILRFFRWVTMSVTTRSRSANPNDITSVEPTSLDDFDF